MEDICHFFHQVFLLCLSPKVVNLGLINELQYKFTPNNSSVFIPLKSKTPFWITDVRGSPQAVDYKQIFIFIFWQFSNFLQCIYIRFIIC